MIIIDITLAAQGRGLYAAYIHDRLVVEKSKTPIFAAACVLIDQGNDDIIVAKHAGSTSVALLGRLGILAGLAVTKGDYDSPASQSTAPCTKTCRCELRQREVSLEVTAEGRITGDIDTARALLKSIKGWPSDHSLAWLTVLLRFEAETRATEAK